MMNEITSCSFFHHLYSFYVVHTEMKTLIQYVVISRSCAVDCRTTINELIDTDTTERVFIRIGNYEKNQQGNKYSSIVFIRIQPNNK